MAKVNKKKSHNTQRNGDGLLNSCRKVVDSASAGMALIPHAMEAESNIFGKASTDKEEPPSVALITRRCHDVLRSVISTKQFEVLSNILNYKASSSRPLESAIQTNTVTSLSACLDLELISLRLSSGAYGQTPDLFSADIQKVWKNVHCIGSDLVKLANFFSELSHKLFHEQVLSLFHTISNHTSTQNKEENIRTLCQNATEVLRFSSQIHQSMGKIAHKDSTPEKMCDKCGQPYQLDGYLRCHSLTCTTKAGSNDSHALGFYLGSRNQINDINALPLTHASEVNALSLIDSCVANQACKEALILTSKGGVCQACGKYDDNVLLCDSCDAAYHMNCLTPAINKVPDGQWYCPCCVETDKKSVLSHDATYHGVHGKSVFSRATYHGVHACAVCTRVLGLPLMPSGDGNGLDQGVIDMNELQESEIVTRPHQSGDGGLANACKVCGIDGGKVAAVCLGCGWHYHLRCLRPSRKRMPNGVWFCPSCLCRVCKIDADDDKILLCDGCDEGFHIYCLDPPLSDIPAGSWLCSSCITKASPGKKARGRKRKKKNLR